MAKVKIRTVAERQQAGKSLREKCPRLSHGKVVLGQDKRDIIALIKASNEGRLENLIPIRHARMLPHGIPDSRRASREILMVGRAGPSASRVF